MERGLTLRELRELHQLRQGDLAKTLNMAQGKLSQLEKSDPVARVRAFVEALGMRLEVVAVKGLDRFPLTFPDETREAERTGAVQNYWKGR